MTSKCGNEEVDRKDEDRNMEIKAEVLGVKKKIRCGNKEHKVWLEFIDMKRVQR